jgi:phosphoenolpyruvate phosphomutase
LPYLNYKQRLQIVKNIEGISKVVPQDEWDYSVNILKVKPDYFVHGDDWNFNGEIELKKNAIKALKKIGGKLVEIRHTKNISSSFLKKKFNNLGGMPDIRKSSLKRLLNTGKFLKFIEVHSPISGIVIENTVFNNKRKYFYDGFWSSSLTDSINHGRPDNESLDISKRLQNISTLFDVTSKPLIMDFDSGGKNEHFIINIKSAERLGISAVIIEDKKGLKQNSLMLTGNIQPQESIQNFCKKISLGKKNKLTNDFMIIARIESLIKYKPVKEAIKRAKAYVASGADGIMIHSNSKSPKEIIQFAQKFRKITSCKNIPLICVPSTYNKITDEELKKAGFNIVIYANHLMRASIMSMEQIAKSILKYKRTYEIENKIYSIPKILNYIK